MSTTMHIEWSSWSTVDDVAQVVRFYEHATTHRASVGGQGEHTLEGPTADHKIAIFPAGKNDQFPHCDTKPEPTARTVILISQAIR